MNAADIQRVNTGEKILSVFITWLIITVPTVGVAILSASTNYRFPYPDAVPYWLTIEAVITVIVGMAYLAGRRTSRSAQTLLSVLAAYFGAIWPTGVLAVVLAVIAPLAVTVATGPVAAAAVPLSAVLALIWWAVNSTRWLVADLRDIHPVADSVAA